MKKDADSPSKRDDPTPLPGTPANGASSSEAANATPPPPPPPPVPKETVTFKAGASNPPGLQNLVDFLIRVLKRKDVLGVFAHPPTGESLRRCLLLSTYCRKLDRRYLNSILVSDCALGLILERILVCALVQSVPFSNFSPFPPPRDAVSRIFLSRGSSDGFRSHSAEI